MKTVAIVGLGLMGGSLGLALKRRGAARVVGYARRVETRRLALELGAADAVSDSASDAVRDADRVVFCAPVETIPALAAECRGAMRKGCVVTDVGSTKAELILKLEGLFGAGGPHFVGSHPMAGSEKTGVEAAHPDLYVNAITAVTPTDASDAEAVRHIAELWTSVGARVVRIDPAKHDALVARTSHLPHLAAAVLVASVGREITPDIRNFCGPGFRDTTRVASGSPEMWRDIVATNRAVILAELRNYEREMGRLVDMIERGDFDSLCSYLDRARVVRGDLLKPL